MASLVKITLWNSQYCLFDSNVGDLVLYLFSAKVVVIVFLSYENIRTAFNERHNLIHVFIYCSGRS